jgi:hypothetical protein
MKDTDAECPECGNTLTVCIDSTGRSYQCHNMTCLSSFEADEIEEGK